MGRLEDNLRHAHMIKDAESSLDDAVKLLKEFGLKIDWHGLGVQKEK